MKRMVGAVVAGAFIAATALPAVASSAPRAEAGPSDGSLGVNVIRDVNGNGSYEPALEVGVAGATVTVVDGSGATTSGTTGVDGTVAVDLGLLSGGKYRVQVDPPADSVLQPAPSGSGLSSTTSFVDVSGGANVALTVGLWNPADYCQENPTLVTACQRNALTPGVDPAARSLVSFPFTARGTGSTPAQQAAQGDTGTVYGIAYRKQDKRVFSGAFAKRAAAYGPGGPGAIYVTDTATNTTTPFATVPDAGATAHAMAANFDLAFANVVGKESLGDIDISEDGSTLYVVNMADRRLYTYDATAATAGAPTASYAIPSPGCQVTDDWHPGALGVRDGVVYVGGICSGESTQNQADMRVVVRTFDPATGAFGAPVVDKALTFERGSSLWTGTGTNYWMPWQTTFQQPTPQGGTLLSRPEPLLTDIGIESNGDLVLAFRDRFGDQGGKSMPAPDGTGLYDTVSGGDLNRVCRQADGSYVWEGISDCPNHNTPANNGGGQLASVVEYYNGEYYSDATHGQPHKEIAQGALAMVYGADRMPSTVMDPTDINTGGVGWFGRSDGSMANDAHSNAYLISDSATEGWGKANGLGDLEALCDLAPVQIGDRVWYDADANGVQDPAEPAISGVTVQVLSCDGSAVLATKTTDAQGLYYFGTADGLEPETCYSLRFDYSAVDPTTLPGSPPTSALKWTKATAGDDRRIDSNVDATGKASVTVGKPGSVDHTIDAGVVAAQNRLGDLVWVDVNRNGVQDADEPGVAGVPVTLRDGSGNVLASTTTGADGTYLFDRLVDGAYSVCFDLKTLPAQYAGYLPTRVDAGGDDAKDSDADMATGCTPLTTLGPAKREDLTLDAGIRPPNSVGDYVWIDANKNGLQDDGEQPVPGVTVKLSNGATTTTDDQGKYLFTGLPDGEYEVCFDLTALPAAVADYQVTTPNAGDDAKDSDADPATGCAPKTTLNVDNAEDLTIDLGLIAPVNRLGDYVWIDANKNGLQDDGEQPVSGVTVKLDNGATTTTDDQGKYLFTDLPNGTYTVCFDLANLPAAVNDYVVTTKDAGDDTKDSDADAAGCTTPVELGVGKRENLTLDMGLVSPPNSLGDYVWLDGNKNGVQDDGEVGVPDMPVKLSTGQTTTTDANGEYLFTDLPDGTYSVCFGPMPAAVADYQFTTPNAGDDGKDSDADVATGCTPTVELGVGKRENLTLDAGISAPVNRLGDYVWIDANKNGLQDEGESPVSGVTVKLDNGATTTTDDQGKYLFTDLLDGTYTVCFDVKTLPAPVADYTVTTANAGDDVKDSDADPATGCVPPVELGVGKRENLTLDMGLVAPPNKLGDLVWSDTNRDGLQDPGEPGVPGVSVKLVDDAGTPVGDPVRTGPDGRYEFANIPDGTYTVCFDMSALPGDYAGYLATKPNAGEDAQDSDVDVATGCTPPATVGVGKRENLTLDLGLVPPTNRVGDFVWFDDNANGVQDPNERGVPDVPVLLQDGNGVLVTTTKTGEDGKYLFTDLPDGEYEVCFGANPQTGLVAGRRLTKPNAGDDGMDSDADPATACTPVVTLGKDKRVDLTLDAGLLPPAPGQAAPLPWPGGSGPLAWTGVSVWTLLGTGLLLLAGGACLVLTGRQRRA